MSELPVDFDPWKPWRAATPDLANLLAALEVEQHSRPTQWRRPDPPGRHANCDLDPCDDCVQNGGRP